MRRAEHVLEHLDARVPRADREASLADVHRLNTWFGGYGLTLRAIGRVLRGCRASEALVVLDVGGGHGHFAGRLQAWARRRGLPGRGIVVDREASSVGGGPLSVRRSYSPTEVRELAEKAGITNLVVRRYPWLGRVIAVSA